MLIRIYFLVFSLCFTITAYGTYNISSEAEAARTALMAASPKALDLDLLLRNGTLAQTRLAFEQFLTAQNSDFLQRFEVESKARQIAEIPVIEFMPLKEKKTGKIILYVHGGAFVFLSASSSFSSIVPIAASLGVKAIAVDYCLAPEGSIDDMHDVIKAVVYGLLREGYSPRDIGFLGDSAGAALIIAVVYDLLATMKGFWGIVALSPWVDLTCSGDSIDTMAQYDPILRVENYLATAARLAVGEGKDLADPRYSVVNLAFSPQFPRTLVQVGTREILFSQGNELTRRMKTAGVPVEIDIYDGMWHVFQATHPELPESKKARKAIEEFFSQ